MSLEGLTRRKLVSYAEASIEDRCAERTQVALPASLRSAGGRAFGTLVLDLSLAGFCARCPGRVEPGSQVWLTLPGLEPLQAEVIWWERGDLGAAFARLLSPAVHDSIIQRYRAGVSLREGPTRQARPC